MNPAAFQLRFGQPAGAAGRRAPSLPGAAVPPRAVAFTFLLMAAIFLIDIQIPLGVAAGVPYVWAMLSSHWSPRRWITIALAIACTALTYFGYLLSPPEGAPWMVISNRILAVFAIWLTTFLCIKRKQNQTGMELAQQELTASVRLLHSILNSLREGVIVGDGRGGLVMANPAATSLLKRMGESFRTDGTTQAGLEGIERALPGAFAETLRRAAEGWRVEAADVTSSSGGERRHFSMDGAPMFSPEGELTGGILTFRDVTQSKALEQAIVEAAENEQRRIGRDLHDSVVQQISGVLLIVQTLRAHAECRPVAPLLEKLNAYLGDALAATRALAHGLFPVELERYGLAAALELLARQAIDLNAVRIETKFDIAEPQLDRRLDAESATHLFRIAQEALSNACRHASARRIELRLAVDRDGRTTLTIDDDGAGLSASAESSQGIGLRSMAYRAKALGGELKLAQSPLGGLRVQCSAMPALAAAEAIAS